MDTHPVITWQSYEYEYREKTPDWYWALGIITVAGSIAAFLLHDFLFGVFIIIAGFTLAMYGVRRPNLVTYEINKHGIAIGEYLFPYPTIKSFYITTDPYHDVLLIMSDRLIMPLIAIPIVGVEPEEIESLLVSHIPEIAMEEPIYHKIMDRLGF